LHKDQFITGRPLLIGIARQDRFSLFYDVPGRVYFIVFFPLKLAFRVFRISGTLHARSSCPIFVKHILILIFYSPIKRQQTQNQQRKKAEHVKITTIHGSK